MWDGFGGMFREADGDVHGFGVLTAVQGGGLLGLRGRAERRRLQREAEARYAALLPLRPARPHLELPHRAYYLWRGPLALAALFAEYPHRQTPTLFWPTDRSWFVASDLDSGTTEIGGPAELLEPLLAAPWHGRLVDPSGPLGT